MTAHDVQTAATEPQIGAVPEPAHGAEIVVPLNRLKASSRNARKVRHSAAAIEALAASIRAKGVLQAPVVEIERGREGAATGNYLVTIGEGRRQALRMLVKRKAIKRTHPVKVVVDRGRSVSDDHRRGACLHCQQDLSGSLAIDEIKVELFTTLTGTAELASPEATNANLPSAAPNRQHPAKHWNVNRPRFVWPEFLPLQTPRRDTAGISSISWRSL